MRVHVTPVSTAISHVQVLNGCSCCVVILLSTMSKECMNHLNFGIPCNTPNEVVNAALVHKMKE